MGKAPVATRRRRKTAANPEKAAQPDKTKAKRSTKRTTRDENPLGDWVALVNHPATWVLLALIAIPYGANLGWRKAVLQTHLGSRPPVRRRDERQVLVLGSLMAFGGRSQNAQNSYKNNIATILQQELGLEIGYQDSDAAWNFVRDGTASWIHGLRFFERGERSTAKKGHGPQSIKSSGTSELFFEEKIRHLCRLQWALTYDSRDRYGFESTVFGNDAELNDCSVFNPDARRCQLPVCEASLQKEYGCARKVQEDEESSSCDMMPFRKTLLQTRQPWHIVRSLVERYCWKKNAVQDDMPSSLEALLGALDMIPLGANHNDTDASVVDSDNNSTDSGPRTDHCVNQFIDYVAGYYNTVLDESHTVASGTSDLVVRKYKIEETSPCEVAELAGLLDPATTVYPPNHERVQRRCKGGDDFSTSTEAAAPQRATSGTDPFLEDVEDLEAISVGQDLVPHTTPEHLERIKQLFQRLEYEYSEE